MAPIERQPGDGGEVEVISELSRFRRAFEHREPLGTPQPEDELDRAVQPDTVEDDGSCRHQVHARVDCTVVPRICGKYPDDNREDPHAQHCSEDVARSQQHSMRPRAAMVSEKEA